MNSMTSNLLNNSLYFLISLLIYIGQRYKFYQKIIIKFNVPYVNYLDFLQWPVEFDRVRFPNEGTDTQKDGKIS